MGNLWSVVEDAIVYVFCRIFSRNSSYSRLRHSMIEGENAVQQNGVTNSSEESSVSLTIDQVNATSNNAAQSRNFGNNSQNIIDNTAYFQETLSRFFQNFEVKGNLVEEKPNINGTHHLKEIVCHNNTTLTPNHLNSHENVNASRSDQLGRIVRNGGLAVNENNINVNGAVSSSRGGNLTADRNNISVSGAASSSRDEESARRPSLKDKEDSSSSMRIGEDIHGNESLRAEDLTENVKDTLKASENMPSIRKKKYGMVPTDEILRYRERLIEHNSKNSGLDDQNVLNEPEDNENGKESENSKQDRRKAFLAGRHYGYQSSVEEENKNMKLSDSTVGSEAHPAGGETYHRFSHEGLRSGGLVVFGKLSDHLSIPNYYFRSNSVYCDEPPLGDKIPEVSSLQLVHRTPSMPSCSPGGNCSRRVSLPDIYPEKSPLMRSHLSKTSSRVSQNSVRSEENKCEIIFEDLLTQSQAVDDMLASPEPNTENLVNSADTGSSGLSSDQRSSEISKESHN